MSFVNFVYFFCCVLRIFLVYSTYKYFFRCVLKLQMLNCFSSIVIYLDRNTLPHMNVNAIAISERMQLMKPLIFYNFKYCSNRISIQNQLFYKKNSYNKLTAFPLLPFTIQYLEPLIIFLNPEIYRNLFRFLFYLIWL